ncbi:MAG: Mur ligase family protein [Patescibacteria group bacterium]
MKSEINNLKSEIRHIHFIGICGVAMSALAIALKEKGHVKLPDGSHVASHIVTGSDKGFYPPVSDNLKNAGVSFYPGWHPEKMGMPDLVVVGNVAGSQNPEWLAVREKKIPYLSYPEVIREYLIRKNSIVCAGTYGKSTSSALLAWILREAGYDPSYMFGGVSLNDMPAAFIGGGDTAFSFVISSEARGRVEKSFRATDSPQKDSSASLSALGRIASVGMTNKNEWSIVEGDEYKTSGWDDGAKFLHYQPTHLLLSSVVWDHADVYETNDAYVQAFERLITLLPNDGLLVLSAKVTHNYPHLATLSPCRVVTYGKTDDNDYQYSNIQLSMDGISFDMVHRGTTHHAESDQLGDYLADNFTGCFALCQEIGIPAEKILASIQTFKSIKRRLEKRYADGVTVFDDIAHSPKKAEAVLRTLRTIANGRIIAVFEPNTGNRFPESIPGYADAFRDADTVIIPRLSTIKRDPNKPAPLDGNDLADVIRKTHPNVEHLDDDEALVTYISSQTKKGDIVVFLGSHGFRGMIEALVEKLSSLHVS